LFLLAFFVLSVKADNVPIEVSESTIKPPCPDPGDPPVPGDPDGPYWKRWSPVVYDEACYGPDL